VDDKYRRSALKHNDPLKTGKCNKCGASTVLDIPTCNIQVHVSNLQSWGKPPIAADDITVKYMMMDPTISNERNQRMAEYEAYQSYMDQIRSRIYWRMPMP
jgi:hypothetical protein